MRRWFWIITLSLAMIVYQGCLIGAQNPLYFKSLGPLSSSGSSGFTENGNGHGYDGKPDPGDYYRVVPEFECNGQKQKQAVVGKITVQREKFLGEIIDPSDCKLKSGELSSSQIAYSPYNKGLLGFKDGVYVKSSSLEILKAAGWKPEALCRNSNASVEGVDALIEWNSETKAMRARLVVGEQNSLTLVRHEYGPSAVQKIISPAQMKVRYYSDDLDLSIDLSRQRAVPQGTFSAHLTARVDNQPMTQTMDCRMATQMDTLGYTLAFTGNSAMWAPASQRVFTELDTPAWNLEGTCDPQWGDVTVSGSGINLSQIIPCRSDGTFALAINYDVTTPFFTASGTYPTVGGRDLQISQGPATPKQTRLILTMSAAPPQFISTAAQLQNMAKDTKILYILTQDIDVAAEIGPTNNWTPIGRWGGGLIIAPEDNFRGIIEGNGHTISGIHIQETKEHYVGFIGYFVGGRIQNLHLKNITIVTDKTHVGALAGMLRLTTVYNVTVENVQIKGLGTVGGLVGMHWNGSVENVRVINAQVEGNHQVGGLTGSNWAGGVSKTTVDAKVVGIGGVAGGLIGYFRYGTTGPIVISDVRTSGSVSGAEEVGGLIGLNDYGVIIERTLSTSEITVGAGGTGGPLIGKQVMEKWAGVYEEQQPTVVRDSYWMLGQTCTNCSAPGALSGEGKSRADLLLKSTYMNWNFVQPVWTIQEGLSLPEISY